MSSTVAPSAPSGVNVDDYRRAMLNILEDASEENARLQEMQRAVMNVLDDVAQERGRQEDTQRAALNILEDFAEEKGQLKDTQRAALNILEDFVGEKTRLEDMQRAMLNLLDDFGMERERAEAVNEQLRETIESLRRANDAADAANRELEAFAYSVSHDLRAPLRAIAGFGDMLYEDYFDKLDEEGRDSLQRIVNATEKMGQLIDDLLNLSRLTRADLNLHYCNLSQIARRILEAKQAAQPSREVDFVIEDGVVAEADEHLITVLFENLLENAWKFTGNRQQARIEFGSQKSSSGTAYYVRDNGAGFDMKYVDKLFQPFQRLHAASDFPGTGIGLATVKRIIQRHNGTVWIEGEKDAGTSVYFTL